MIGINLLKQEVLHADPEANFTGNLDQAGNTTIFFIIAIIFIIKKLFCIFTRNYGNIVNLFCFNVISI